VPDLPRMQNLGAGDGLSGACPGRIINIAPRAGPRRHHQGAEDIDDYPTGRLMTWTPLEHCLPFPRCTLWNFEHDATVRWRDRVVLIRNLAAPVWSPGVIKAPPPPIDYASPFRAATISHANGDHPFGATIPCAPLPFAHE
jgi:hypothetical protein